MNFRDLERTVMRITADVRRRVLLTVGRAVLTAVNDATKAQTVEVALQADEVRADVERFQEFGFTSVPPNDTEAIVVFIAGNRAHGVVIATESRTFRPMGLTEGEACVYTSQDGKRLYCKSDGTVELGTTPSDFVALASLVNSEFARVQGDIQGIVDAITNAVPIVDNSGAGLQTSIVALMAELPSAPVDVDATEVKAK